MITTGRMGRRDASAVTMTAASAMPGKLMTMSRMRMSTSETTLPAVAAIEPSTAAATSARPVAARPTISETRAPKTMREKTSRPGSSVPNQNEPFGGMELSATMVVPTPSIVISCFVIMSGGTRPAASGE